MDFLDLTHVESILHNVQEKILKEIGDREFADKDFVSAAELYTKALELDPEDTDLLTNRSMAYINVGCCELALTDSEKVLFKNPCHEKCLFQKVKSLWGLKRYGEALRFINTKVPKELLKRADFSELKDNGQKVLKQMLGEYDILEIMDLPKNKRHDIAEYTGPLEIAQVLGKGRGVLATREISPGELILCSKAYAIQFSKWPLAKTIARKLIWDPKSREHFCKLYAGPDSDKDENWLHNQCELFPQEFLSTDKESKIRSEIFQEIGNRVMINAFKHIDDTLNQEISGLWILPSYINHSCIDVNAKWIVYGDIMMVHAVRPIKAGEEIVYAYVNPMSSHRPEVLLNTKFRCLCTYCKIERSESSETRKIMQQILESIQKNLGNTTRSNLITQFKMVKKLMSFRVDSPGTNIYLAEDCISTLATQLMAAKEWKSAIEIYEAIRNVFITTTYLKTVVSLDNMIIYCCVQLRQMKKVEKWKKQMNLDLVLAFGKGVEKWDDAKREAILNGIFKSQNPAISNKLHNSV